MDILIILLPLSVSLAGLFVVMFIRAVRGGQFDDIEDAAYRALDDN